VLVTEGHAHQPWSPLSLAIPAMLAATIAVGLRKKYRAVEVEQRGEERFLQPRRRTGEHTRG